jgi:hypothetical protein
MNLNFVRVGIVALALAFAGLASAQDKTVGYDIAGCAPDDFMAAHVEVGKDVVVISVNPGPDRIVKLDIPIIYKFVKEDKDGKHYVQENGMEMVIAKQDSDTIIGKLVDKGETVAVVFGIPGDGSKLGENGKKEFETCKELQSKAGSKSDSSSMFDPLDGISRTL